MGTVPMCEAIEAVSDEKAEIKWVNDIFVHGKKVWEILTKCYFNLENGFPKYAIFSMEINIYQPCDGFPNETTFIVGSVFQKNQNYVQNRLVSEFLNSFYDYYPPPHQTM